MNNDIIGCDLAQFLVARRPEIEAAMARHFAGAPPSEPSALDRQVAAELVGLLVGSLSGGATGLVPLAADRRHQTEFGDGLTPILRDVLGDAADPPFLARCVDGYWRAIRAEEQTA